VRGVIAVDGDILLTTELELEDPRSDEVLVRIERCGLCQTDLHIMDGTLQFPSPVVCGHEAAGVVEGLGASVTGIAVGARVVLACRPPCRTCWWCLHGQQQLCSASLAWATGGRADGSSPLSWRGRRVAVGVGIGAFAEHVIAPARAVIVLPDDVPSDIAAILGCAVLTGAGAVFNTARVQAGQTVLVLGLGGVGASAVQAALAAGAGCVIGGDPRLDRRLAAASAGADVTFDPGEESAAAAAAAVTDGRGADVVIDAVGDVERTVLPGFMAVRPGGHLVIAGVPPSGAEIRLPAAALVSEERHVSGCFIGSADPHRDIPFLIDMWRAERMDLGSLVTDVLPLADLPRVITEGATPNGIRTVIAVGDTHG
jgi:Zn-dependent alcohol dehydrogenase